MRGLEEIKTKIFADGADLKMIAAMAKNPLIRGFTTNPTLMHKNNITDYKKFSLDMLRITPDKPISFEVFSDDFQEMEEQALEIASWGRNVYVKIPITNTRGDFSGPLIQKLAREGVRLNVTALMTAAQVERVVKCLSPSTASCISVFAGRIADTGRDPLPIMTKSVAAMKSHPKAELIWASPRELLNVFQADSIGCHIITVTPDILSKLGLVGKDLDTYSLETVQMFYRDAQAAKFTIDTSMRKATTKGDPR